MARRELAEDQLPRGFGGVERARVGVPGEDHRDRASISAERLVCPFSNTLGQFEPELLIRRVRGGLCAADAEAVSRLEVLVCRVEEAAETLDPVVATIVGAVVVDHVVPLTWHIGEGRDGIAYDTREVGEGHCKHL